MQPTPAPAPTGCFAGRSLQTPRKPKLTSHYVRSRTAPGRLTQHPPHHALSHQDLLTQHQLGDFTGTSRFPAGKGPATPLFMEGLLSAHGKGKPCPDEQTRDRNKPPHFLPVAEVSSPAQGLFPPPHHLLLLFNENALKKQLHLLKKKQSGVAFTESLPAPEEHSGVVVPTVALGTVTALFRGVCHPFCRFRGGVCSPERWREGSVEGWDIQMSHTRWGCGDTAKVPALGTDTCQRRGTAASRPRCRRVGEPRAKSSTGRGQAALPAPLPAGLVFFPAGPAPTSISSNTRLQPQPPSNGDPHETSPTP